jgi:hypothetical protein
VVKAGFTPGVSVGASAQVTESDSYDETVVPQLLQIGNLRAEIENEIKFEGVEYEGDSADIIARTFTMAAAGAAHHSSQSSTSISMKIPIPVGGCAAGAPSVSGSGNQSKMDATTFAPSYLHLTAKLKVRVEEMKIIGVDVEAEIVDIETNNLLVASVQDVMKSKGHSFSVSLSPGALNSADGSISNGKSAWTQNFGNIIGRSALTIIAQDTIALAGGLIANAERDSGGHYTDKGNLKVTAGKLIISHLHDYDDGLTLGLGITPAPKSIGKDVNGKDVAPIYGHEGRMYVGYKDKERDVFSAIGQGSLNIGGQEADASSFGAKAPSERVSSTEGVERHFDVEFVTSTNHKAEQAARDNFKEVQAVRAAAQNPSLVKEITPVSHQMKVAAPGGEAGDEDRQTIDHPFVQEQNAESVGEEENIFVSFLKGLAKIPSELFGAHDAEAAAIAGATIGVESTSTVWLAALLSGRYIVSGSSLLDVATGAVVGSIPATLVASMPFIVYLTDQNAVARLDAKKQLAAHLGIPHSQVFDSEKVNLFDQLASGDNSIDGTYDSRHFNQLHEQYIDGLIAQKQKELSASRSSAKMGAGSFGLEEDEAPVFFKKGQNKDETKIKASDVASGAPNDPDFEPEDDNKLSKQTKELLNKTDRYKKELLEREGAPKNATSLRAAKIESEGGKIQKPLNMAWIMIMLQKLPELKMV